MGAGLPVRAAMVHLQARLNQAGGIADAQLPQCVEFAERVLKSPNASRRDKLRAAELLKDLAHRGDDIAVDISKLEERYRPPPDLTPAGPAPAETTAPANEPVPTPAGPRFVIELHVRDTPTTRLGT